MVQHPNSDSPLTFTTRLIDRAALLRGDDSQVRALLTGGAARIVPVWNQKHFVTPDLRPHVLTYQRAAEYFDLDALPLVFLGLADDAPWFALGLPHAMAAPDMNLEGRFTTLQEIVSVLSSVESAALVYARAMVIWHFNHAYCGRCGAATEIAEAGHSRGCTNSACGHTSFPRTDPAVITLVTDGPRCLLGRQPQWPPGMYSTIAGFVEPGETLEATVEREVREETGVKVGNIRYLASQPWPFPSSIMLGFRADALSTEICRQDDELADCRWFTRRDLDSFGEIGDGGVGFKLPNSYSIARFLVEEWRREG